MASSLNEEALLVTPPLAASVGSDFDISMFDDELLSVLKYPEEVEEAIAEVISGSDPLDGASFNPVDYINSLFPSEQSLANIDDVVNRIRHRIRRLDDEIRESIRSQTNVGGNGKEALEAAKASIGDVFEQIKNIKEKADKSEEMVKEITWDIKQLDHGKRHLTSSITTLNHLHMLVGGVDGLVAMTRQRQYAEIFQVLQGVLNVLEHFRKYLAIPQIRQLADRVQVIQQDLAQQIMADFKDKLSDTDVKPPSGPNSLLADACKVVSVLEPRVKDELITWFVDLQLQDHLNVFHESFDVAWIDQIDRRFTWAKRVLIKFEEDFEGTFPPEWVIDERICREFCRVTKNELTTIMAARAADIDVKLLLFTIQRTSTFEAFLAKRFPNSQLKSSTLEVAVPGEDASPFAGLITKCFEPHLHIYIESQDKNLQELMEKFASDGGSVTGEAEGDGAVLPSAGEVFVFYKKCMVQCIQLSTGEALLGLTEIFKKFLQEYANRMLLGALPKAPPGSTGLASILKDKDNDVRFSSEEKRSICRTLTTAEYCQETTQQLQDKLKEKIDHDLVEKVNLNAEQDSFHAVISNCITLLVQDLESACEPALTAMMKVHWQSIETVGDQSTYVNAIAGHLRATVPSIRDALASSRKYFTQFCVKFVNSFVPRFINTIYKCKPMSTAGAEQLLLDTHSIKTWLLDLPSLDSTVLRKPPASFTKVVAKGMSKAEMILKVVMSPHTSPEAQTGFVDSYVKLLADADVGNFQKVLELKGLKRSEQQTMLELFRARQASDAVAAGGSAAAAPGKSSSMSELADSSRIRRLEKLIKKQIL